MLRNAILLTGDREFPHLSRYLRSFNENLICWHARNLEDLERMVEATAYEARLISFTTATIVPKAILEAQKLKSYNFHPGPPTYPGRYPESFAVYYGETRFGATAHEMYERVDEGPIIGLKWFDVPPDIDRMGLAEMSYKALVDVFAALGKPLALATVDIPEVKNITWTGRKWRLSDFNRLKDLSGDLSEDEIERRKRAFHPREKKPDA